MPDTEPTAPLDLSAFDNLDPPAAHLPAVPVSEQAPVAVDPGLASEPVPERLVEISNLSAADLAAAEMSAAKVDFRNTTTLLAHGDGALAAIAQSSRQLLTGVRLEDAGEVGRIAASVIDGVNILRIQDLQAEAKGERPVARKGLIGKLLERDGIRFSHNLRWRSSWRTRWMRRCRGSDRLHRRRPRWFALRPCAANV
jgi:hypothetical protein